MSWLALIELILPLLKALFEALDKDKKTNGVKDIKKQVAALQRKLEKHIA